MTEEENKENRREDDSGTEPEPKAVGFARIIADKDTEIAALRKSESELKEKLAAVSRLFNEAVASYKNRVLELNPKHAGELIAGETIEAGNDSWKRPSAGGTGKEICRERNREYQSAGRRARQAGCRFIGAVTAGKNSIRNRR